MATVIRYLDYKIINKIVSKHDRAYRWPDRTCIHPIKDLLEYIRDEKVPIDPIAKMSEEEAGWLIVRIYGSSWFKWAEHYLINHDYGYTISPSEIESGDIVEISSDRIKAVGPVGHLIPKPVAIVADKETLFLRGFGGVTPLPIKWIKVVNAARFRRVG